MKSYAIYLSIFLSTICLAQEQTLYVKSDLKEEVSSEEAILLVQCLTANGNFHWQLEDQVEKRPLLHFFEEKEHQITMELNTGLEKIVKTKNQGELLSECELTRAALEKTSKDKPDLTPVAWKESSLPDVEPEESNKSKLLPWVIGAGVIAGAILIWKSRQPNFTQIHTGAQ